MKKTLSVILVLSMVLSLCTVGVFATEEVIEEVVEEVVEETPVYVAKIGDVEFETIVEAVSAAEKDDVIKLISNVELGETVVIPADKDVVLDLCGYIVSMEDSSRAAACAIKNNGNLTIKDSSRGGEGKITFVSTTPSASYGYSTSAVINTGALTVKSGNIENTTVGGASYAIDTAWYTSDTSITIEGGTITSQSTSVRQVPFSATAKNVLTIKGGTITGGFAGVQTHNISNAEYLAEVNIIGGTITGTYAYYTYYSCVTGHRYTDIDISGGNFNGYVFIYNGNTGSSAVDFENVSISKGLFNGGVYVYTYDSEDIEKYIPAITGGDYTEDPSWQIAKGYARCASEVEGYAYSVAKLNNDDVQVAPVAPKVEISEELEEEIKIEIEENAYKATIDGIDDVVNTTADQVSVTEEAGKSALEAAEIVVADDATVNIFVQPSLDVEVKDVDTESGTLVLDIKAMVQTYATTAETVYDMVVGTDAVAIGEPEELDTEDVEVLIIIPVPESIIGAGDDRAEYLTVKHVKDDDEVYYYKAIVNEDNTITFVNPHGFSEFIVSPLSEETIVAEFGYNGNAVKDAYGNRIEDVEYEIYDIGSEIILPTAKKSGYSFKGWKLGRDDKTYKNKVELTQEVWDMAMDNDGVLEVNAVFLKNKDGASGVGGGGGGEVVTSYTVAFNTNGGSQIESVKVFKGNKVSYPVAPVKEGATFEAWYIDAECTDKYDFNKTVYSSFTLYAKWIGETETIFGDVTENDWFFDAVNKAYQKGLMNGMEEGNFWPQYEINRAMFVTVLHRIDGNPKAKAAIAFTDVPVGAYYEDAVAWAVSSGIVEGYGDGVFGSSDPITREQMAVMLYRFAQYKGVKVSGAGETFSDADNIAEWAKEAVDWATGVGVLNGMGDGTYAPKSTATRAQGAAVFVRIEELVK